MLLSMLTLIDLGTLQLVSRLTVLDSLALLNTNIVTQSSQTGYQGTRYNYGHFPLQSN